MEGEDKFSSQKPALPRGRFSNSQIVVALGVVFGIVFVLFSFYLLLFSPILANDRRVIPIRKSFYEQILEKWLLPKHLPYTAFVRDVMMTVVDKKGKNWEFDCMTQTYPAVEGAEQA